MRRLNFSFIFAIYILIFLMPAKLFAASDLPLSTNSKSYNLLFVIDSSNSINATDPEESINEFTSLFIDTLPADSVQVGVIMYNSSIVTDIPLTRLTQAADRNAIKSKIATTLHTGYTDTGLALKKAVSTLINASDSQTQSVILLISDGEIALPSSGQRTEAMSINDRKEALKTAITHHIPVFTYQLGDYDGKADILASIAKSTGGLYAHLDTAQNVFENFLAFHEAFPVQSMQTLDLKEGTYDLDKLLAYTQNKKLLLYAPGKIQKLNIPKLPEVTASSVHHLSYEGVDHLSLKIDDQLQQSLAHTTACILGDNDISLSCSLPDTALKNVPYSLKIQAKTISSNEVIKDQNFYTQLKPSLKLFNNAETLSYTSSVHKENITYLLNATHSGKYVLNGSFNYNGISFTFPADTNINFTNAAPETHFPSTLKLCENKKKAYQCDLNNYFTDANKDPLTYTVETNDNITIQGSTLVIDTTHRGDQTFKITAADSEGATISTSIVTAHVLSIFQYYQLLTFIILLVLALAIVICYILKKYLPNPHPFSGKIEGSYLSVDHQKVFPFSFALYTIPNKNKVTLYDLLQLISGAPALKPSENIKLLPGADHTLCLIYSSDITLMINSQLAAKGKIHTLHYGDIVHISFEELAPQIEFKFVRP